MAVPVYLGSMVLFCLLSVAVNSASFPRGRSYGYAESGQRLTEEPQYYRAAHYPSQHDQVHSSSAWSSTFLADLRSKSAPVDFRLTIPFQRLSSPPTTSTSSPASNQKGGAPCAGPAQGGPDPNQESAPSGSDTQREVSHSPIGKIQGVKGRWVFIPDETEPTDLTKTQTGKTSSAIYPIPLATGPPQYETNPSGYSSHTTTFPMYYPNQTSSIYPVPMWYGPTQDVKVPSGYNPGQVKPPTSNFGKGPIGQANAPKPITAAGPAPVGSSTPQPGNVPSGHYQGLKNPTTTHFGTPQTGGQADKKPSPVQTGSEPDSSRMESSQNRRPALQRYNPSYGPPYSVGQYKYKPPTPIKPDPVPTNVGYGQNGGAPSGYYYPGQENFSTGHFGKRLTEQTMPSKPTVDPVPNTSDPTHYGNNFLVQTKPSISNSGIGQAGKKPSVQKGSELGPPSPQIRPDPQSYTPSYGSPYSMDSQYTFNPPRQKKPSTSHSGKDQDGKKLSPGPISGPVSELYHSITGSSDSEPAPQSYTPTYDAPYSVGSQYNIRRPVNPDKTDYHRGPVRSNVGYGQNVAPSSYYYSGQEQPSTSYFDKARTGQTRPPKRIIEAKPYPSLPATAQGTADPSKTFAARPSASPADPYSMYGQYNYQRPVTPDQHKGDSSGYYSGQQQPSTNYFTQGPTGQPMLPTSIFDVDPVPYPTHYRTFYPGQTQLSTTNSGGSGQVGKNPSLGQQGSEHGSPNRKYSRPVPHTYSPIYGSPHSVGDQNAYNLPMPVKPDPVPNNVGYDQNVDTQKQPAQKIHTKLIVPNLFLTQHGNYYTVQKQPFTPNLGMGQAGKKPSPATMTDPVSVDGQRDGELVSSRFESPQGGSPAPLHYIPSYSVPYSVGSQYNRRRPVSPDKTDYHRGPVRSNVGYGQNVAPSSYYYSQEQPSTSYLDKAQTGQTNPPKRIIEAETYPSQPSSAQSTADPSRTFAAQPSASSAGPYSMYGQYNYQWPVTPDQHRGASNGYYSGQQQQSISYFSRGQTAKTTRPIPIIDADPVPYASNLYQTYYPGQTQPSTNNSGGGQADKKPSPGQQGTEHGSPNPKSSRPVPHIYTPGYGSPYNIGAQRPVTAQTDYYPVPSNIGYGQNGVVPSSYYYSGQENPSTSYIEQNIPPKAFIKAIPYPSQPSSAQSIDDPSRNSAIQPPVTFSQHLDHKPALEVNMVAPFHSRFNPNAENQITSDSSNMEAESGEEPSLVLPTPESDEGAGPRGFMQQILPQRNYAQSWSGGSRRDVVPGRPEFRMN